MRPGDVLFEFNHSQCPDIERLFLNTGLTPILAVDEPVAQKKPSWSQWREAAKRDGETV